MATSHSLCRPFNLALFAFCCCALANRAGAQQHCWVKYTYDLAGNRTERSWWCGTPSEEEVPDGPKAAHSEKGFGLVAAPNPAATEFVLRSEVDLADAECRLVDEQGRTVLTQRGNGTTLLFDVSELAVGLYALHVRLANEEFQTRLIIAR